MDESEDQLSIDEWANDDDKFAMRVEGDFMIGDHIADGDFVVIDKRKRVENGKIVAFRDDEGDLTLRKYFREKNGRVRLEPSSKNGRIIVRDNVEILGVLVGVVRKY